MNQALSYLKEKGVEEKDIKTIGYSANPKYEYVQGVCDTLRCPPGKQVLSGYEVNQTVSVKTKDTDLAGELLTGIGSIGVSQVSGIEFTVDDEETLKRDARKLAIEDAREKAGLLADDLDVKIVRIVSFNEDTAGYPMYNANKEMSFDMRSSSVAMAPEPAPLPVGENQVILNVTIVYEIR
jgi:uncharacterized protein YggE